MLICGVLFVGAMFVFVVSPQDWKQNSAWAVLLRGTGLVFGSLGFGMIETFGLRDSSWRTEVDIRS